MNVGLEEQEDPCSLPAHAIVGKGREGAPRGWPAFLWRLDWKALGVGEYYTLT